MPRYVNADWLLERAVPIGWSTPKWVSDIVIEDAPTADVVERKDIEAECELAYKHGWSDCFAERRWIPVTERLPEDGQRVLVTYDLVNKYPWVNILRYGKPMFEEKPCFYECDSEWGGVPYDGIVAWMPLPKPYREETSDV